MKDNFVAKHARLAGNGGRHEAKVGKHAKRSRQKAHLRRQLEKYQ